MERRKFLQLALASISALAFSRVCRIGKAFAADAGIEKLSLSDDEWKKKLKPEQYDVLRHEGTERPFTSELLHEMRKGTFACAGCGLELFSSDFKFDSGTGWPSFFDSIPGRLQTKNDYKMIVPRSEYHCARCGGHHGHVFDDGPKPTGLRYCNNGVALTFIPNVTQPS